ncbi:sugar kinase [Nostocoides sp. HKS02]|uniref:sugar kinase n=1 Tax=Nostocoides sp. HKS02 TaxID=1813880 RepID=UPI0012B44E86|nr:sugar kinase [Tetrasphaera sp. HKS02]QGN59091.1 sugar kinase [Tetrasphaera sp. HKS02]
MTRLSASPDVVTLGEAMAVLFDTGGRRLEHLSSLDVDVAGSELNVAIGLRRLGHATAWIGRVGDDAFGRRIEHTLRGEGVDVSRVVRDSRPTGALVKEQVGAGAVRVAYLRTASAGSRVSAADLPADFAGVRLVHLSGITPAISQSAAAAVRRTVELTRDAGATLSFDVNYRAALWPDQEAARHAMSGIAQEADIVFASESELALVAGVEPAELVVTRGSAGASVTIAGETCTADAVATTVRDTLGAGDAFVSGYLSAWLDGLAPQERLERGVRVGAFAVASHSDWQGLPTRSELALLGLDGDTALR